MAIYRFFNGEFDRGVSEAVTSLNKRKIITPSDRIKRLSERYESAELLNCPFCGGSPRIKFTLHEYGGNSGMAGAYHVSLNLACLSCGAGFEVGFVFTNVTAPGEDVASDEEVDKVVLKCVKKWNRRVN